MSTITAADTLDSIDPATGAVVGQVPITPVEQIRRVVGQARAAQAAWSAASIDERADALRPAGRALDERAEALGELLTREMGKPLAEGVGEARHCGTTMDATLDEIARALAPDVLADERAVSTVHHDPLGVSAAITPWNFPLAMPHWLVVPALVAGNTVILKPSEETPLIAQAYADVLAEHLPADVLQVVVHGADEQGRALVESDVDLIAFTGSRDVGGKILGAAGPDLKRVILELGGKDPLLVLDDADVEAAAAFAVHNSFRNAGQVCVSTERIYVDERVADAFEVALTRGAADVKQGEGMTPDVTVGPMINARQRDQVLAHIDDAVARGAIMAAGGGHHDNFVTPTVLTNVDHDMKIMREETFGPVACVMRVRDADEAVTLANDTPFGLGAVVFGGDEERAAHVARRLAAGMVGINRGCGGASGTPWVGARQSGFGYHSGRDGHRQFTQTRVVTVAKGERG